MASSTVRVRRRVLAAAAAAAFLLTPGAQAQDEAAQYQAAPPQDYPASPTDREWAEDEIPAHLAIVDGEVTLERDARVEAADENIILLAGDRLRTGRGRAEVLFADGSALDLDEYSGVDLLSDALVRMLEGRLRLSIARGGPSLDYRVDTAAGSVFIRTAGDYRLTLSADRGVGPELDLAVLRGSAELANDNGRTLVRAGTHALASPRTAPSLPFAANSAAWDTFDRWVEDQRDARLGAQSARYLPAELHYYSGAFDRYGSWGYDADYGYIWYPTVSHDWRPYSHGRWSFVGHFGWVWVGVGRWTWPTHHYGRWGYRNRWYWIPERRWSPAWVSWAASPGYLSWCPLGWDNRPVISITNIHVTRIDPWIGWTVAPRHAFRSNVAVARYAVARQEIGSSHWSQFAVQRTGPARPATVQVRDAQPLRAPTARFAAPRTGVRATDAVTGTTTPRASAPNPRGIASARSGARAGSADATTQPADSGARRGAPGTVPRLTAPRDNPRVAAPRTGQRPTLPSSADPQGSAPSRAVPSRERAVPSRDPDAPTAPPPSRTIRSREPVASPAPPTETPSWRLRSREPVAPDENSSRPSRTIRSREPAAPPAVESSPWSRPRPSRAAPPARTVEPPADRPSSPSPWMRSRPAAPRSAPPSASPGPPSARPAPSAPPRGWSAPARAPRSQPSSPPPSAERPSRGGGESRAPATSSRSSSGGRGQAVRRGGGGR
jgi:hypothetical protein